MTDAAGEPVADELLSITHDTPISLRRALEQRALQIVFTDNTGHADQANYTSNLNTVISRIQSRSDWHSLPATGEEWQPDADTKAAARAALLQLRSEMDGQEPKGLTLNHRIANRFNWDIRQRSDIPTGDWCWRTWMRILEEIDDAI